MKSRWKIVAGIVVLGVIVGVVLLRLGSSSGSAEGRKQAAPLVKLELPTRDTVRYDLQLTGDVLPVRQASIVAKVGGTLERNFVDMGTRVRAGRLLAVIDSTELRAQYQQAAATWQNTSATYQRLLQLSAKNLASTQDVDNARAATDVAKAGMDLAATRLGYARVSAPFSGVITRRFLDPGALVTANASALFTLMDLDTVKVIVWVPEKNVPSVYQVRDAEITLDALPDKVFRGRVTRYSDALDLATRSMAVEVSVANSGEQIKPGMFATVDMKLAEHKNVLTVPANIVLRDDKGTYVYVVENATARQVRVALGFDHDNRVEVTSGLQGAEHLVVAGQQFVRNGGPVTVQ